MKMQYGLWEVLGEGTRSKSGRKRLTCRCVCGVVRDVQLNVLESGESKSCGKHKPWTYKGHRTRHSPDEPLFSIWYHMMTRCYNLHHPQYHHYGGRGVVVCDRWHDFENFVDDVGPHPGNSLKLDRFPDNEGNYEPANVRWATRIEQANNTRGNRLETAHGKTQSRAMWAREIEIPYYKLVYRLDVLQWKLEDMVDNYRYLHTR